MSTLDNQPANGNRFTSTELLPKQYAESILSKLDNGSIDSLDSIESGNYAGIGSNPPVPPSSRRNHKRPSSKDLRSKAELQKVERHAYANGEQLASTVKDTDYLKGLELAKREHKPKKDDQHSELVSGRNHGTQREHQG